MLEISKIHAQLGKIANNLEKHGDDDVSAFDVPVTGILLDKKSLNRFLDDSQASAALFNTTRTNDTEPVFKIFKPLVLKDTFEGIRVDFNLGGKEFTLTDCKASKVSVELRNGGTAEISLQLRVRPENDKQILLFLGYQNREIDIALADAKVALKGGQKQGELALEGDDDEGERGEVIDGRASRREEDIGRAQAQALAKSKPAKKGRTNGSRPGAH